MFLIYFDLREKKSDCCYQCCTVWPSNKLPSFHGSLLICEKGYLSEYVKDKTNPEIGDKKNVFLNELITNKTLK